MMTSIAPSAIMPRASSPRANSRDTASINILLATFAGLGLPRTLSLQQDASASIGELYETVFARLPDNIDGLVLTTVSNKQLSSQDPTPISSLLHDSTDRLLSLRLSRRLCGGKGGFGSQLRAAGGRMSSRKKRDGQEGNPHGSNRNLDGRRLRTIDEAKKLAEYLAIKPEMAAREKEERKKRWEAIVETADKREADIRSGRSGANGGRLDAEYVESKEAAEEKTREAVLRAMREDLVDLQRTGSESSRNDDDAGDSSGEEEGESSGSSGGAEVRDEGESGGMNFFGWDEDEDSEDDEDMDDDGVVAVDEAAVTTELPTYTGKGKARLQE